MEVSITPYYKLVYLLAIPTNLASCRCLFGEKYNGCYFDCNHCKNDERWARSIYVFCNKWTGTCYDYSCGTTSRMWIPGSISELISFSGPGCLIGDRALQKPTAQASRTAGTDKTPSSNAVDGQVWTIGGPAADPNDNSAAWWAVDLQQVYRITKVVIIVPMKNQLITFVQNQGYSGPYFGQYLNMINATGKQNQDECREECRTRSDCRYADWSTQQKLCSISRLDMGILIRNPSETHFTKINRLQGVVYPDQYQLYVKTTNVSIDLVQEPITCGTFRDTLNDSSSGIIEISCNQDGRSVLLQRIPGSPNVGSLQLAEVQVFGHVYTVVNCLRCRGICYQGFFCTNCTPPYIRPDCNAVKTCPTGFYYLGEECRPCGSCANGGSCDSMTGLCRHGCKPWFVPNTTCHTNIARMSLTFVRIDNYGTTRNQIVVVFGKPNIPWEAAGHYFYEFSFRVANASYWQTVARLNHIQAIGTFTISHLPAKTTCQIIVVFKRVHKAIEDEMQRVQLSGKTRAPGARTCMFGKGCFFRCNCNNGDCDPLTGSCGFRNCGRFVVSQESFGGMGTTNYVHGGSACQVGNIGITGITDQTGCLLSGTTADKAVDGIVGSGNTVAYACIPDNPQQEAYWRLDLLRIHRIVQVITWTAPDVWETNYFGEHNQIMKGATVHLGNTTVVSAMVQCAVFPLAYIAVNSLIIQPCSGAARYLHIQNHALPDVGYSGGRYFPPNLFPLFEIYVRGFPYTDVDCTKCIGICIPEFYCSHCQTPFLTPDCRTELICPLGFYHGDEECLKCGKCENSQPCDTLSGYCLGACEPWYAPDRVCRTFIDYQSFQREPIILNVSNSFLSIDLALPNITIEMQQYYGVQVYTRANQYPLFAYDGLYSFRDSFRQFALTDLKPHTDYEVKLNLVRIDRGQLGVVDTAVLHAHTLGCGAPLPPKLTFDHSRPGFISVTYVLPGSSCNDFTSVQLQYKTKSNASDWRAVDLAAAVQTGTYQLASLQGVFYFFRMILKNDANLTTISDIQSTIELLNPTHFVGCLTNYTEIVEITDSTMSYIFTESADGNCRQYCANNSFTFASVQSASTCYCHQHLPGHLNPRSDPDTCPSTLTDYALKVFGVCLPGSYGLPYCNTNCSSLCVMSPLILCEVLDGSCVFGCAGKCPHTCPVGTYAYPFCDMECPPNCVGRVCDVDRGNCLSGCVDGWIGERCDQPCPPGMFGRNCRYKCSDGCKNTSCEGVTGECYLGCRAGFKPPYCKESCYDYRYGENCSNTCGTCLNKAPCNRFTGHCLSSGFRCSGKLQPPHCRCLPGYFINNQRAGCRSPCGRCANFTQCNYETGFCPNGCLTGYQPPMCVSVCPSGRYGLNCSLTCGQCLYHSECSHTDGVCLGRCKPSYYGIRCDKYCSKDDYDNPDCAQYLPNKYGVPQWTLVVLISSLGTLCCCCTIRFGCIKSGRCKMRSAGNS